MMLESFGMAIISAVNAENAERFSYTDYKYNSDFADIQNYKK